MKAPTMFVRLRLVGRRVSFKLSSKVTRFMSSNSVSRESMRISIVGGGAAGLSASLHLAPLVERGLVTSPIDIYVGALPKNRPIGVGLWSTALEPFQHSWRKSHQLVWEDFVHYGKWVGKVGYKSPSGSWLAMSELPTDGEGANPLPSLLFLREMDMLQALRKAVHLEELQGTVKVHQGEAMTVEGIQEDYRQSFSAPLLLKHQVSTERDYHLIIAADGMDSTMRKRYGGHRALPRLMGIGALPTTSSPPKEDKGKPVAESLMANVKATETEDRGYTVFRGNAELSVQETGMNGVSFQTWGEGKSMRFATVPMSYPMLDGERKEKQVWFITTSDKEITQEPDAEKRREMLLESFSTWHDPICKLVEATPANEILMEQAMAHKHSVAPVTDLFRILSDVYKKPPPSSGPGPAVVFVGDAFMTVDPILAQGFTIAMESTHDLAKTVESSCLPSVTNNTEMSFDPTLLRRLLKRRYDDRTDRLIHLLRATDIVQALGQPHRGMVGSFCRYVVRPAMRLTPGFIKTPIFNWMLTYSLGLPAKK